jgi:hypothetical protein
MAHILSHTEWGNDGKEKLNKQVAISFEDNIVKVVYVSSHQGRTIVQKTMVFKEEDFDSFLNTTKLPDLTVICHFKKFYSDIMIAPPTKTAYLKKIVEAEIKIRFPDLKDFSYFFTIISEKTSGEKGSIEIFFFAVDNSELTEIIERFNKYGKSVKYIYPDILTLSYLIKSSDELNSKTVLPMFISGTERTLFLVRNGQICFIRVTPSSVPDLTDVDVDNMNMTVNYCRQKLRLNPEFLILMNTVKKEEPLKTIIPAVPIDHPTGVLASDETIKNFIVPICALIFGQKLKNENLLPIKYKTLNIHKSIASHAAVVFLILSLIGLVHIFINISQISLLNEKINVLRKELTEINAISAAYDKDTERMQQILPLINFVNEAHASPDMQKTLLSLKFLPMENVHINTIQLTNKKDSLLIQVTGVIKAKNYGDMYRIFVNLLNNFHKTSGVAVISKNIELRNGHFQIDVENRG